MCKAKLSRHLHKVKPQFFAFSFVNLIVRVKSYLKWIFAHAIKPKKYITAPQGRVVVGNQIITVIHLNI